MLKFYQNILGSQDVYYHVPSHQPIIGISAYLFSLQQIPYDICDSAITVDKEMYEDVTLVSMPMQEG